MADVPLVWGAVLALLAALGDAKQLGRPLRLRSATIPGNLPLNQKPQFILITHDDFLLPGSLLVTQNIVKGLHNPNTCGLPVTWFATRKTSDPATVRKVWAQGYEVAAHTLDHAHLRSLAPAEVMKQIAGTIDWLVKVAGVPAAEIVGFRSPYLESSPAVLDALLQLGIRYDSTLEEPVMLQGTSVWPYTLDGGAPRCGWAPTEAQCLQSHFPGLWEVPLYKYPGMRRKIDRPTPFASFSAELRQKLATNRAPVVVALHPGNDYGHDVTMQQEIRQFLTESFALGESVWAVTITQLIDWMEAPVPLSQMKQFMASYRCPPS